MIKLHKFGPMFGLPDASPFVMKVETYLRMTDQKYETLGADVRKAPRKMLPCVEIDGTIIPDSTEIIEHLEGRAKDKLDAHLSASDAATALAYKTMMEEHLYFGLLYMRWTADDGWAVFEQELRPMLKSFGVPGLMTGIVARSARKQTVGRTARQGLGRAPREGVVKVCNRIIDALAVHLGDRRYFCGDRPTTYDATAYAFVAGLLCPKFQNEVLEHTRSKKNLVEYEARMKDAYWKE